MIRRTAWRAGISRDDEKVETSHGLMEKWKNEQGLEARKPCPVFISENTPLCDAWLPIANAKNFVGADVGSGKIF